MSASRWIRSLTALAVGVVVLVLTGCEAPGPASPAAAQATGVFRCPGSQDVGALVAAALTAGAGGPSGCQYQTGVGVAEPTRVTIEHPPTTGGASTSLPDLQKALAASGSADIVAAPQFSSDAFQARFDDHSCSVWARAADGRAMSVLISRPKEDTDGNCALARSITALVGTDPRPAPSVSASNPSVNTSASDRSSGHSPVSGSTSSSARTKTTHPSEPNMFTTGAAQTPSIPDKP